MIKTKLLHNKQVFFGLVWNQSTKDNLALDIKTESERLALGNSVFRKHQNTDGADVYQFALCDSDGAAGGYAAADLLSSALDDVIYIYAIDAEFVWVCVIHDGEIVSGGDIVFDADNFVESFKLLLSDLDVDIEQFKVYADKGATEIAEGIYEGEVDLLEIISKVDFKSVNAFKKTRKVVSKKVLLAVGAALIVGTGYLLMDSEPEVVMIEQPRQRIEDMRLRLPKSENRVIGDLVNQKVGPSKSQVMEDAYQEELAWLNYDFNINSTPAVLKAAARFIRNQDMHTGGWVANNYYYDISSPHFHEVVWSKKTYGTALTLKGALESKGINKIIFNDKGTKVSSFVEIEGVKVDKSRNILDVMKNNKRDLFFFMHDLDMGNFTWTSELTPVSERPKAIEGITNTAQAKKRQLKVQSRNFKISGSGLDEMNKLSVLFNGHDRFVMQRLSFDFNQNFNWIVYGVFYEKEVR